MRNPFIILSSTNGRKIRINATHIVTYDQRKKERSSKNQAEEYYTYIVMLGGTITRTVEETPREIDNFIAKIYT
jgi:hypothetical protein